MNDSEVPHHSVLLHEIKECFQDKSIRVFFDGTLGAGGHAKAILESHPEIEHYLGIDQDPDALAIAKERLQPWSHKLKFIHANFSEINSILERTNTQCFDGALVDLGVSSMQLDRAERGFSFSLGGPLDMRMNPLSDLTAAEIVNTWPEQEIARIFREYGEEKKWRIAARAIVEARKNKPIETTHDLVAVLRPVLYNPKRLGINPLTLVFQALRICVNSELEALKAFLPKAIEKLSGGSRLAIISFHSLEDRIVKNGFRHAASDKWDTVGLGGVFLDKDPTVQLVTKKPICPSDQEIGSNPRSRSAKLRIIEKLGV